MLFSLQISYDVFSDDHHPLIRPICLHEIELLGILGKMVTAKDYKKGRGELKDKRWSWR